MSNYLAVVFANSEAGKVRDWLERHSSPEDDFIVPIGYRRSLLIVSKNVRDSVGAHTYFRGVALSTDHSAMAFGIHGWLDSPGVLRQHSGDHAGEYCSITWRRGSVRIERDLFGNARLLTTQGRRFAAVSDSLIVLASLRRAMGEELTLNTQTMLARTVFNNTAGQQMSPSTMFEEIRFIPAGVGVKLARLFEWTVLGSPMARRMREDSLTLPYRDSVRAAAADVVRVVQGLAAIPGWTSILNLSGGYDSRVVFGAAVAGGCLDRIFFASSNASPLHARDYEVATGLAAEFGMSRAPAQTFVPDPSSPSEALTLWAASLLGVYDGFGPLRATRSTRDTLSLTGIGAEMLKGNWGWKPWPELVDALPGGPVRDAYDLEGRAGISAIGGDPEHPHVSELYYLGYRNGLHAAAGHIGVHMVGVHPLQLPRLARMGHSVAHRGRAGTPGSIADLSLLVNPAVAMSPYDQPERNISAAEGAARLAALGGPLDMGGLSGIDLYGHPRDVPEGASALSMSIARSLGVSGAFDRTNVLDIARQGFELLPNHLRPEYESVIEHAEWRIGKVGGHIQSAGASTARAATLIALRLL